MIQIFLFPACPRYKIRQSTNCATSLILLSFDVSLYCSIFMKTRRSMSDLSVLCQMSRGRKCSWGGIMNWTSESQTLSVLCLSFWDGLWENKIKIIKTKKLHKVWLAPPECNSPVEEHVSLLSSLSICWLPKCSIPHRLSGLKKKHGLFPASQ